MVGTGGLDVEPVLDEEAGVADTDAFLAADKIDDGATYVAIAVTDEAVLGKTDTELGWVVTVVEGTGTAEAVAGAAELNAIVLQHLLHGDGLFQDTEADELGFHGDKKGEPKLSEGLGVEG